MKKIILLSAIALLILTTISCEKEELPEATQIGANTLGCKINGKPFTCTRKLTTQGIPIPGIDIEYQGDTILRVSAHDINNTRYVYFSFEYDGGLGKYYDIEDVVKGTNSYVEITRFSDNIISGHFEITIRRREVIIIDEENHVKNDTLITKYTEGRFDVKL